MPIHRLLQRSLMIAVALSLSGVASAHVFPKPLTKAEVTAERAKACRAAAASHGKEHENRFVRFGPPARHSPTMFVKVAGRHRFGSESYKSGVACPLPNIASLSR